MRNNLLKSINIIKAVISYNVKDDIVKKNVRLKYVDDTECYFIADFLAGYQKPTKKLQANLTIYTADGIYKTKLMINNVDVSLKEIFFTCDVPRDWEFIQMRRGGRKALSIPFKIEYNDGYVIEAKTFDLAPGGFAFITEENIGPIYRKVPANVTMQFEQGLSADLPDGKFTSSVVFVREIDAVTVENPKEKRYAYRFANLSPLQQLLIDKVLKSYN